LLRTILSFYFTHPNINIFVKTLFEYQCFIYIKIQSIRTQIIVKTKKVKEAEKFVSQKIFEYDNSQISEYDYVDTECPKIGVQTTY
jgi:hypothetical protein